jgi:NAD(P)H-hydrate epimerase
MTSRAGAGGYGGSQGRRSRSWDAAAPPELLVTTASEASELDALTIAAGVPSRALMQRAGAAAAGEIFQLLRAGAKSSVVIYVGSGNNGGDGWVVARSLAAAAVRVDVVTVGDARTDDARAERELAAAEPFVRVMSFDEHERDSAGDAHGIVVDALLGTGAKGAPREPAASAIARIARSRESGATVVSLDIPSGVDADSGAAEGAVRADLTLTFGSIKRGMLAARAAAGRIVLLDIGLARVAEEPAPGEAPRGAPRLASLVDGRWVCSIVPLFAAAMHKGSRRKLVIVGGQLGMAGAPVLAARAAMRSGIGMVRLVVAPESLPVVQGSEPHALARAWPGERDEDWEEAIGSWADVVLVGPGLGASGRSREMVERLLASWRGPVVLDADALNVFAGEPGLLGELLAGRPALLTPHVVEFARLSGLPVDEVLERRFDVGAELARGTGATVLLKGVPTVVSAPDGSRLVSAAGTPALAAAGSGDLLGGIAATLLAQIGDAQRAGAAAAWVHGRAAEIAESRHWRGEGRKGEGRAARRQRGRGGESSRGVTLADIDDAIGRVWAEDVSIPGYPVLVELVAVGST